MAARDSSPSFMNGVPELLILQLLAHTEMYGYQLVQSIQERTGSAISLSEGVVYPVLHALEQAGALKSRRKTVNGRSRIYYTLTRTGTRRLATLSGDWTNLTSAIQKLLAGEPHAAAV
ncbi:MAG: helix-turn-helix transcriptional regulator [Acidobacteriaceae bacterium]